MGITFDGWTSKAHLNYLVVTGHFIRDAKLEKCLLAFYKSSMSHASDDLKRIIEDEVIEKYNLKIFGATTVNASNMGCTCRLLKIEQLPCVLHSIQIVIDNAICKSSSPNAARRNIHELEDIDESVAPIIPLYTFFIVSVSSVVIIHLLYVIQAN